MISYGTGSSKGIGKEVSEDSFYADVESGIFIVADGMYGDGLGKTASQTAIDVIAGILKVIPQNVSSTLNGFCLHNMITTDSDTAIIEIIASGMIEAEIKGAFEEAHAKVVEMKALGSTVLLAYVWGDKVFIAYAGDSRAYMSRDGFLEQLTEDHSLVAASIKLGVITEEEARNSRHKDILTRALGRMNHHPDIRVMTWQEGDVFLLTTDGLAETLNNVEIGDIIRRESDQQGVCERLIELARLKGAKDDITTIVFRVA